MVCFSGFCFTLLGHLPSGLWCLSPLGLSKSALFRFFSLYDLFLFRFEVSALRVSDTENHLGFHGTTTEISPASGSVVVYACFRYFTNHSVIGIIR